MSPPRVKVWHCVEPGCTYFRAYNVDERKADEIVDHPLYGKGRNIEHARFDIRSHKCSSHAQAVGRLRDNNRAEPGLHPDRDGEAA